MASRLHQRSARDALFSNYDAAQSRSRPSSGTSSPSPWGGAGARGNNNNNSAYAAPPSSGPSHISSPYSSAAASYPSDSTSSLGGVQPPPGAGVSAYPTASAYPGAASSSSLNDIPGRRSGDSGFRAATPDKRGRYSDAVLSGLESQNEEQVGMMAEKVKMLKNITLAIGDEIRDSTALAEKMNDSFEGTRNRLRGTMNRMLRMAERTGVGWRIWLGFFAFVFLLFTYVWLF